MLQKISIHVYLSTFEYQYIKWKFINQMCEINNYYTSNEIFLFRSYQNIALVCLQKGLSCPLLFPIQFISNSFAIQYYTDEKLFL